MVIREGWDVKDQEFREEMHLVTRGNPFIQTFFDDVPAHSIITPSILVPCETKINHISSVYKRTEWTI